MKNVALPYCLRLLLFIAGCSLLTFCVVAVAQTSGLYAPSDGVVELTAETFESQVLKDDSIWIVQFYTTWCSHCHAVVPEYRKLAKALKGAIKLGAVNGPRHPKLSSSYGIRGFPVIKIFGADKLKPIELQGPRTARNMADTALEALKAQVTKDVGEVKADSSSDVQSVCFDSDVTELQGEQFNKQVLNSEESWLVEFYTPWCPHCKNLVPEWIAVAKELKGRTKVGAIDASEFPQLAGEYKVRSYPTILFFPAKTQQPGHALEYKRSQRTAADILDWARHLSQAEMPTVAVAQILNEASLRRECGKKAWCLIALLPPLKDCDAKCRNQLLETLRRLGGKYKEQRWGWVWSEAGQQPPLERGMRITSYPSLAVVNCRKMRIGLHQGAFEQDDLDAYLSELVKGQAKLNPVSCAQIPHIRNVKPWNGLDSPHQLEANSKRAVPDEL